MELNNYVNFILDYQFSLGFLHNMSTNIRCMKLFDVHNNIKLGLTKKHKILNAIMEIINEMEKQLRVM